MEIIIDARVIYHDRLGKLEKGRRVDVPENQAKEWLSRGWATRYETKVMQDRPLSGAGALLSASPVAQASPPQTLSESSNGAKKRGRPKKEA